MDALIVAIDAVTPYLIYLSLGWLFVKTRLVREGFLQELNQVIFRCLFPITMFYNTHNISVDISQSGLPISICAALLAAVIAISVVVVPRLEKDNARRGVIIQALYRSNIVLFAMGMVETLFGTDGVALVSVIVALFVPLFNVIAIVLLEYYRGGSNSASSLMRKVLSNPLFLGGMAGIAFSCLGVALPDPIESTVSKLSALTTPLAMIVLGGTIHASGVVRDLRTIAATLFTKMVIEPAVAIVLCKLAGLSRLETFICFIMFAVPIAASSYTMAQNMGGDGELAGELVAVSTVASLGTLFVWIFVLRSIGFI